jgi:hypothetical protein
LRNNPESQPVKVENELGLQSNGVTRHLPDITTYEIGRPKIEEAKINLIFASSIRFSLSDFGYSI